MVNAYLFIVGVTTILLATVTKGSVIDLASNGLDNDKSLNQIVSETINQLNVENQKSLDTVFQEISKGGDASASSVEELSPVATQIQVYTSASASIMEMLSKQANNTGNEVTAATSIIDNVLWPLAFSSICNSLSDISEELGHILDKYTGPDGMECTSEQRNVINSPLGCWNADTATNLVTQVIWPLAFQGLSENK